MEVLQIIIRYEKTQAFFEKGFEMTGMSEGILGDEKNEIADNFKSGLSSIFQGRSDVPSYLFKCLNSGRYYICRISSDADSESYICHGLIVREGYFPVRPAYLIGSAIFEHDIYLEQGKSYDLPVLTDLEAGNSMTYGNVSAFIKQRMDLGFKDMLSGILSYSKTHVPLTIVDEQENLFYWIAALQTAFPIELSHKISFTTCPSEGREFMIETLTSIIPAPNQDDKGFVFDYSHGIRCSFKALPNFLKIINTGLTVSKAVLDTFHRFINSFNLCEIDWDMEGCYSLFLLSNFKGLNITHDDIKSAFMFADIHTPEEMLEDVFRMIEPSMTRVVDVSDLDGARISGKYIFRAALASNKVVLVESACYYINCFIDHFVLDDDNPDIEGITELYAEIACLSRGKNNLLFKYPFLNDRINYLAKRFEDRSSPEKAEFYLCIIFGSAIELGYYWNQMIYSENLRIFIDTCISLISDSIEDIFPVIEIVKNSNEFLVKTVVLLYNRIKSASIMKGFIGQFIDIIDSKDEKQRLYIRKAIADSGCIRLLFDEYSERLLGTQDILAFFDDYHKNVFGQINELWRLYFSEAVKMYVQKLPFEYTYEETQKLVKELTENNLILDDTALSVLINAFEDSITIIPPSDGTRIIIQELKKIKKSRSIITKPNVTSLIDFGMWLESLNPSHTMEDIFGTPLEIELLDEKRYSGLVEWYLPNIIGFASSPEDYKRLMHYLGKEGMELSLHLACLRSIEDILAQNKAKGANLLLQFSIYYFFYLEPRCRMIGDETLLESIRLSLQEILTKQPGELVKQFDLSVKKEFLDRKLSLPIQWGLIFDEVINKNSSHSSKGFLSIFKRR